MYLTDHGKHDNAAPAGGDGAERRRHRRRSGAWAARVETTHGDRVGCVVLDLSPGGARVLLEKIVDIGELVTCVTERFGAHRGRVAWVSGARVGLAFVDFASVGTSSKAIREKPEFLRGRADVLRRVAQTARNGETVAGLLWAAKGFDEAAQRIEAQQRWPAAAAPSIRKEDILFGRSRLPPADRR